MTEARNNPNSDIDNPEEEKAKSVEIFGNEIADFLSAESEFVLEAIEDYNAVLIMLLDSDPQFRKRLENALYDNQRKITNRKFFLDGKPKTPTIGNWLKDFIKAHGTGMFDNVVLTQFISVSPNARILDTEERNMLNKLLQLYRNLKFFPESLKNIPPEEWQIIPVKKGIEPLSKSRTVAPAETKPEPEAREEETVTVLPVPVPQQPPRTEQENPATAPTAPPVNMPQPLPPRPAVSYVPEPPARKLDPAKERVLIELYHAARQYPEGSIQRRAIEEEIAKIKEEAR